MWDDDGENILEHFAGIEDFDLAMTTYRAACLRWPGAAITIRQGARIIEHSRKRRLAVAGSTEPSQKAAATPKKAQRLAHRQNHRRDRNGDGTPSWREVRVDDWGARGYAPSDYQRGACLRADRATGDDLRRDALEARKRAQLPNGST